MRYITEGILSDTDKLIALSLSTPSAEPQHSEPNFLIEGYDDHTSIRIPRNRNETSGHILTSKETIAFGLIIFDFWRDSSLKNVDQINNEEEFYQRARRLGRNIASSHQEMSAFLIRSQEPPSQCEFVSHQWRKFFGKPDINTGAIDERAIIALDTLEEDGLVIDPGITETGLVVLAGLVPIRWSVRTPRGEDVYREIKIQAPFWDIRIQKRRRGPKKWSDWDFNIRGLHVVKKVLRLLAEEYLEAEEEIRVLSGKKPRRYPAKLKVTGDDI